MSRRLPNWRILLALLFCAGLSLAPAIAEARAGGSFGSRSSSMGSRGLRTYENNSAQPLSRSMTPAPQSPTQPGFAPAAPSPMYGGGSFFQRHPFLTGLAGGFLGSWLFGHSGYAADGSAGGSGMGMLLEILIIGGLIYLAFRLFRGRVFSPAGPGRFPFSMPRSAGAGAAAARSGRGRDINLGDADLAAFQTLHAAVQEAWSAGDPGRLRRLLARQYGADRLEAACDRGLDIGARSYGSIQSILKHGLDRRPSPLPAAQGQLLLDHPNIRGPRYYH
jgi:hypothetical protein